LRGSGRGARELHGDRNRRQQPAARARAMLPVARARRDVRNMPPSRARAGDQAMCGITGYWVRRGDPTPWLADIGAAVETLRRRGPDDSGVWVRPGGRVALGHTRLSILDLSPLGHQPMHSPGTGLNETGSNHALTMVFNGEVYNFAAIR